MSDNKKYYYLKLKEDFFDNEEMKVLESMKNGVEYQNVYLKMCLLSLKSDGALLFKNMLPYSIEMLSSVLRVNIDTIKTAVEIFQKIGLITVTDTETIYMTDIQTLVGQSSTEAERVKKYRQNLAQKKQEQIEDSSESENAEYTNVVQMYESCTENVQNCTPEIRDKSIEIRDKSIEIRDKNLNISSEKSEDTKSAKKQKSKRVSKSQENKNYLASVSDDIRNDSEKLTNQMLIAFKVLDPHYERSKAVLLSWQVDFAKFLSDSKRKLSEIESVMNYALSDSFWTKRIFKPESFIASYQTLYRQYSKPSNKQTNTFYKNFDKEALKDKDFFSDLEEFRNGTAN